MMNALIVIAAVWFIGMAWLIWCMVHAPEGEEIEGIGFVYKNR